MLINKIVPNLPQADQAREIQIRPLSGGITNTNFRIDVDDAAYVATVRGDQQALLGIDTVQEGHNATIAHQYGIGPEVVLDVPAVLVCRFIEGRVIQAGDLKNTAIRRKIVKTLRHCHHIPPDTVHGTYSVFDVVQQHIQTSRKFQPPLVSKFDWIAKQAKHIQSMYSCYPTKSVFCHNDTVPNNMLDTGRHVMLIDWEYAAVGDRFFDLGMLAAYHQLNPTQEQQLLYAYFGHCTPCMVARLGIMRAMSNLRDTTWSMVQWAVSPVEFDYEGFGKRRFQRFVAIYSRPIFKKWLEALKQHQPRKEQPL